MKHLSVTIFITIISRLDLIINLLNNSNQLLETSNMEKVNNKIQTGYLILDNPTFYWILQTVVTIIIFVIVFLIFKKIYDLKDDLEMQSIINKSRNFISFNEQYKNHEFYRLPNESDESFNKRSLKGKYDEKIQNEINLIYIESKKTFKNKTQLQIDKIIERNYKI